MHSWRGGRARRGGEREPRHRVGNHSRVCKGRWSVIHENVDTDRAPGTSISTCLAPSGGGWSGCACGIRILPMPQALSQPCPPESGGSWRGEQSRESLHGPALTCTPSHLGEAFSTRPSCFPGCPGAACQERLLTSSPSSLRGPRPTVSLRKPDLQPPPQQGACGSIRGESK